MPLKQKVFHNKHFSRLLGHSVFTLSAGPVLGAAEADCDQLQGAGVVSTRNDEELSREKSQD